MGSDCADGGDGGGADGDDVLDMLYGLGSNALGNKDGSGSDGLDVLYESDNNVLEKPDNMDAFPHVVLQKYHARNRIA